jgi:ribosomal protein L11 methyltransferase
MNIWRLITVTVDREAQELLSSLLFDLGATGLITLHETSGAVTLGAYYGQHADPEHIIRTIKTAFDKTGNANALHGFNSSIVPDEDWMQKWKEGFEPIEIGRRLLISPSWKLPAYPDGDESSQPDNGMRSRRIVVQIDPGMAFGTGTHETTRMCLEALERHWQGGRLLDVGTGTGILGIAAAKLAADSQITMIDIDPEAVQIATENAAINAVSNSVKISRGEARDQPRGAFDVVVANLTAEVIIDLMADLAGCLRSAGRLILSGILNELAGEVELALARSRLEIIEKTVEGEWAAIVGQERSVGSGV